MFRDKTILSKIFKVFCLVMVTLCFAFNKPALASDNDFQEQTSPLIEEIVSLKAKGEKMESLRVRSGDLDNLAKCGNLMRSYQPQADALREQIESLDTKDTSSSFAKSHFVSAATSLRLCVSCIPGALDNCNSVNSSVQTGLELLSDS